ncbi:MAG: hypothetical protein LVQ94_06600 [Thermoplasmatales archaeon]|nr:hypothetical protein [Thermoplasmatales archaeon]
MIPCLDGKSVLIIYSQQIVAFKDHERIQFLADGAARSVDTIIDLIGIRMRRIGIRKQTSEE